MLVALLSFFYILLCFFVFVFLLRNNLNVCFDIQGSVWGGTF